MAASCPSTSHSDASDQTMVVLFAAAHSSVNSISVLSALYASSTVVSIFLQKYIEMTVERMHSCYSFSSLSHPPSPSSQFYLSCFLKKKKKRVVVSCSLLISLFYVFSPDAELGRVAPAIVSPDRTRYSPTLLDLAS